jgi:predicted nicotinamide N-methyase
LSKFFENSARFPEHYWTNKRVIEVGSGTGLVGIVAALLGADITLTDLAPQLDIIRENVKTNVTDASKVLVTELAWYGNRCTLF